MGGKGDGADGKADVKQPGPYSRARASKELGQAFAKLLEEPYSHQLGVSAQLGIPWRAHTEWMSLKAEPDSELAAYQSEVLAALDKQRRADLKGMEVAIEDAETGKVATIWNMRKHRHESRFRRFYEDAKQSIELSGPDGGAIQVDAVSKMSDAELRKLAMGGDDE